MKAVVIHEHGGLDYLKVEELAEPHIAQNEIMFQVRSASLNHLDIWVRKGRPGLELQLPPLELRAFRWAQTFVFSELYRTMIWRVAVVRGLNHKT